MIIYFYYHGKIISLSVLEGTMKFCKINYSNKKDIDQLVEILKIKNKQRHTKNPLKQRPNTIKLKQW